MMDRISVARLDTFPLFGLVCEGFLGV